MSQLSTEKTTDSAKNRRDLPPNIYKCDSKFVAQIDHNHQTYRSDRVLTVEEAIRALIPLQARVQAAKEDEERRHLAQPITRNRDGQAYILATNVAKNWEILVDEDLWHELARYSWRVSKAGYAKATVKGIRDTLMSHYVMLLRGKEPQNEEETVVDHINRIRHDNRSSNLRFLTFRLNVQNRREPENSTSTYQGVSWYPQTSSWLVQTRKDGRPFYVGRFRNEIEAAAAYNLAVLEIFGPEARLNPIPDTSVYDVVRAKLSSNKRREGSSKFRGVSFHARTGKWQAKLRKGEQEHYIGLFATEEEAALAVNEKARELHGEGYRYFNVVEKPISS